MTVENLPEIKFKIKRQSAVEKKLLHYTRKAISQYNMIQPEDNILVCLSGGKDSFTMVNLLHHIRLRARQPFKMQVFTLDQSQPGWDDRALRAYLDQRNIPFHIMQKDTYSVVKAKIPEGQTYCGLCSRLRRGNIYQYAKDNGFNKVALGHHRDDLITSLLMSIFYNGEIRSQPPKLLTDDESLILIRPLALCQEKDIIKYAQEEAFPIIPCTLCGSQENLARKKTARLIKQLAEDNPKIPSNILSALQNLQPSQLMDKRFYDFIDLEDKQRQRI